MGKLTTDLLCAKEGRRRVVGGEGGARRGASMVDVVCGSILAGIGHGRIRGGVEWEDGESARLRARRIEAGW